jgi:hypothetical protein
MRNNSRSIAVLLLVLSLLGLPQGASQTSVEQRTLSPIADSSVQQDSWGVQWGGSDFLYVENDQYDNFISFLKFDLSALSNIATIESASLELRVRKESILGSTLVSVHSCPDNFWDENEITWETKPSFTPTPIQSVPVVPPQDGQVQSHSWTITSICRNAMKESAKMVSLAISAEKRTDYDKTYVGFCSRETGYKPRLVVSYTEFVAQQPDENISPMIPLIFVSIAVIAALTISLYAIKRHRNLSVHT